LILVCAIAIDTCIDIDICLFLLFTGRRV